MICKKVRKQRKSHVCVPCKAKKLKCDKLRPTCSRCLQEKVACFYEDSKRPQQSPESGFSSEHPSLETPKSTVSSLIPFERNVGNFEQEVRLWDPHDMLIVKGTTKSMHYPFASLSILQHDVYTRSLAASLHGTTLMEWHKKSKCNGVGNATNTYDVQTETGPLPFIETAIKRYIEMDNSEATVVILDPKQGIELNNDVKRALSSIEDIELLLDNFHTKIYPTFPFVEFETLRHTLNAVLQEHEPNVTSKAQIFRRRSDMELLTQLILILHLSINAFLLTDNGRTMQTLNDTSKSLLSLGERLLLITDAAACQNEIAFSCLLYQYISKNLNPLDLSVIESPESLLELISLRQKSFALGLNHPPHTYKRLLLDKDHKIIMPLRWKLWVGLQFLTFQVAIPDGAVNKLDSEYMEAFLAGEMEVSWFGSITQYLTNDVDRSLLSVWKKKYRLCMLTSRLVANCNPINGHPKLSRIVEDADYLKDYISSAFPPIQLVVSPISTGGFDDKVLVVETFIANVVGLGCLMNLYGALSLYFEKSCLRNPERHDSDYQRFLSEFMRSYLQLLELLTDYLSCALRLKPRDGTGYIINKLVIFTLTKVWLSQTSVLLRLSFRNRQLQRIKFYSPSALSEDHSSMYQLKHNLQQQMKYSLDLATSVLENDYFSCFQAVCMFRYIAYAADVDRLASTTIRFWKMIEYGEEVPNFIKMAIAKKWGLEATDCHMIEEELSIPRPLASNTNLLQCLNSLSEMGNVMQKITKNGSPVNSEFERFFELDNNDLMKQFSENLLEQFIDYNDPTFFL